jgi:RNA polymerase sigma factor (sigma-70 family)
VRSRNTEGVGSEHELVASALRGDPGAFATLVVANRSRVEAVVARMLPVSDVEDVVQEALVRAYLGLSQLRDSSRFGSWLCGIAVNLAKMRLRRTAAHAQLVAAGGGPTVEDGTAEEREFFEVVRAAVDCLPVGQRNAVLMHYVNDLSCEEIAELLGTSPGAVRVRLHRAREQLRRELAPFAPVPTAVPTKEAQMIEMKVDDVVVRVSADDISKTVDDRRVVLLKERAGERKLAIWTGPAEGNTLASKLVGWDPPRPMTSDLLVELLRVLGGRVERVTVTELRDTTFYATIAVAVDGDIEELDARPSDAMNLAVRVSAPILVAEQVLEQHALTEGDLEAELQRQCERTNMPLPPGEWHSLSAELLRELHTPPGGGRTSR